MGLAIQHPQQSLLGGTAIIGYQRSGRQFLVCCSPLTGLVTTFEAIGSPSDATARIVLIGTSGVLSPAPTALHHDGTRLWALAPNRLYVLTSTAGAAPVPISSYAVDCPLAGWLTSLSATVLLLPAGRGGVQSWRYGAGQTDHLPTLIPNATRACLGDDILYVFDGLRAQMAAVEVTSAGLLRCASTQIMRSCLDVVGCFVDAEGLVVATPTRVTTFTLDDPDAPFFDTATDYPTNQIRAVVGLFSPRVWVAARDYLVDQDYPFAYGDYAAVVTSQGLYVLHSAVARISGEGIVQCLLTEDGDHILTEAGPCLQKE